MIGSSLIEIMSRLDYSLLKSFKRAMQTNRIAKKGRRRRRSLLLFFFTLAVCFGRRVVSSRSLFRARTTLVDHGECSRKRCLRLFLFPFPRAILRCLAGAERAVIFGLLKRIQG
jgi:hypothetical protein